MDKRNLYRVIAGVVIFLGLLGRFNPRVVLPDSMSWSGDFYNSQWGDRLYAFEDVMNIAIGGGVLLFILTLTDLDF